MSSGSILGRDGEWELQSFQMKPGEQLFLFTDGLIENTSHDGKALGNRDLRKILIEKSENPAVLAERIAQAAEGFWQHNKPDDDWTFAIFQWLGSFQAHQRQESHDEDDSDSTAGLART